jgi:hypothetical protein
MAFTGHHSKTFLISSGGAKPSRGSICRLDFEAKWGAN